MYASDNIKISFIFTNKLLISLQIKEARNVFN